jgi:hypothetical protein
MEISRHLWTEIRINRRRHCRLGAPFLPGFQVEAPPGFLELMQLEFAMAPQRVDSRLPLHSTDANRDGAGLKTAGPAHTWVELFIFLLLI